MTSSTPHPTPNPRPEWITAAAEAIEDAAIPRIGRDLGTIHRDEIVAAGLRAVLPAIRAEVAEEIARAIEARFRQPHMAAAESARIARQHAGKGFPSSAAGSAVPAEGSGHPQPSDDEDGRLCRCGAPDSCVCYPEPFDESRVARRMDRWTTGGDTDATH